MKFDRKLTDSVAEGSEVAPCNRRGGEGGGVFGVSLKDTLTGVCAGCCADRSCVLLVSGTASRTTRASCHRSLSSCLLVFSSADSWARLAGPAASPQPD